MYYIEFISSPDLDVYIKNSKYSHSVKNVIKTNGLTGVEITTIILQTLPILIGLLQLLFQYYSLKKSKQKSQTEKYFTVKGPHNIEFINVPLCDLPELIETLLKETNKHNDEFWIY